jgi:hypothetical protein
MRETKKTLIFGGAAIVLALLAILTAPRKITPGAFLDQGEAFFPEFTDPTIATSLEVINYDEESSSAAPFKVILKDGKWSIPSHYDYPADGQERLAKTAAAVIDIKKDDFRSDNVADHELCGVVDPLDEKTTTLKGRGQRVTLKGKDDEVLADFIIGKTIEDREGFRFVRVPGQKRVYAVRMNIDISTKFSDWIEADLLKVTKEDVMQIVLKDYSINEFTSMVDQRDVVTLGKKENDWTMNNLPATQEVDKTKTNDLLTALDELKIVGVRPKPKGLSQSLERVGDGVMLTQADVYSLQSKGYYFARNGQLLSNEGELQARTKDGVIYTLRFGEVVYGRGEEVSAGTDSVVTDKTGPGENRYLFITTEFDPREFPEPPQPKNTDFLNKVDSLLTDADRKNKELHDAHEKWKSQVEKGRKLSDDLNARFAKWYYVISASSFEKLRLTRKDLAKAKSKS